MVNFPVFVILTAVGVLLVRLAVIPARLILKLMLHGFCGLVCLLLLNTVSAQTGISFPVNAVTVLLAGVLGFPGMAVIALLELAR